MKLIFLFAFLSSFLFYQSLAISYEIPLYRKKSNSTTKVRPQRLRNISNQFLTATPPLRDYSDTRYLGIVDIGTPAQTFPVIFDTGSTDLWIMDSTCTTTDCTGSPRSLFVSSASTTFSTQGQTFSDAYGSGNCATDICASGPIAQDVVCLDSTTICISQQIFGQGTIVGNLETEDDVSGILGLGNANNNGLDAPPFTTNILAQLTLPQFTVWLNKEGTFSEGVDANGGVITFGGFDTTRCSCSVTFAPVTSTSMYGSIWQIAVSGFSIGSFSMETTNWVTLSDTGTPTLVAPPSVFSSIMTILGATQNANGFYIVPSCTGTYPDLVFLINGIAYNVPSSKYIDYYYSDGSACYVQIDMAGSETWIFGDPYLRAICNTYDIGNQRIGFARNLS